MIAFIIVALLVAAYFLYMAFKTSPIVTPPVDIETVNKREVIDQEVAARRSNTQIP